MKTMQNRMLSRMSLLFVSMFVGATIAFSAPAAALADASYTPFTWQTPSSQSTVNNSPTTSGYKNPYAIKSTYPTYNTYNTYNKSTSPYCSYCGSYSGYRSTVMNLAFDFSHDEVNNYSTINQNNYTYTNIHGNNNRVGVNNNNNANVDQNGTIVRSNGLSGRSSYFDLFRRETSSHTTTGNDDRQHNGNRQNIDFGDTIHKVIKKVNIVKHDDNDDDDDRDHDRDDSEPFCELDVSDRSIDEGDRVTLSWDTEDADRATLNEGIGRVDEDGGSLRIRLDEDTTFRMTVEDEDGDEDTCSVSVSVDEDNDRRNDFSSIVLDEEPTQNPPQNPYSNVYLSDIPYTGLDLGPYAFLYWAMIAGLAASGAYVIFFMGIPFVLRRAGVTLSEGEDEGTDEEVAAPVTTDGTAVITSQSDIESFVSALVSADNDTATGILESATAQGASASVFLNRASSFLRSNTEKYEPSMIDMLVSSLESAAKARA